MFDAFISHASEDKEVLVRPLANQLKGVYGVDIWYDEFTLEYGDSLIDSIEKGLKNCKYGVVVLSKNFFNKTWTKHEYKALKTKELMLDKKVILPIWYNITREEICNYSLSLSDKLGICINKHIDIDDLAIKIIKIIRPDIYNNISRMYYIEKILNNCFKGFVSLDDFKKIPRPPIRHENITIKMKARLKLIHNTIKEVDNRSYEEYEEDFRRNTNLDREIIITELIAAAYIDCINEKRLTFKEKLYIYIITLSLGEIDNIELPLRQGDIEKYCKITKSYIQNIYADPILEFKFINPEN